MNRKRRAEDYFRAICERIEWNAKKIGIPLKQCGMPLLPDIYRLARRGLKTNRRAR
jgi:hypothetical protein